MKCLFSERRLFSDIQIGIMEGTPKEYDITRLVQKTKVVRLTLREILEGDNND